jgi:hypothetical protein
MVSRVVVQNMFEESHTLYGEIVDNAKFIWLLELRRWCRDNLKSGWRTYELHSGGGKQKCFVVFEFESQKDEMLFRLYTGT